MMCLNKYFNNNNNNNNNKLYIYDDDDIKFISTKIGSCRPLRSENNNKIIVMR